jgi:hypothetical protein
MSFGVRRASGALIPHLHNDESAARAAHSWVALRATGTTTR